MAQKIKVTSDMDQNNLQTVIDKIKEWCDQWLLPLNIRKCCHMSYKDKINTAYHICDSNTGHARGQQLAEYHFLRARRPLWVSQRG